MLRLSGRHFITSILTKGSNYLLERVKSFVDQYVQVERPLYTDRNHVGTMDMAIAQLAYDYSIPIIGLLRNLIEFPNKFGDSFDFTGRFFAYLRSQIIDLNAVVDEGSLNISHDGILSWYLVDPKDTTPLEYRKVVFIQTSIEEYVQRLRSCKDAITDIRAARERMLKVPDESHWKDLIIGQGSSSGLQGISAQVLASKILIDTIPQGSLRGTIVVFSIAERKHNRHFDVDGVTLYPDVILLSQASGSKENGPLNILHCQRGESEISLSIDDEYEIKNIVDEANDMASNGFLNDPIMGSGDARADVTGPREAKYKRILTRGERPEVASEEVENLWRVRKLKQKKQSIAMISNRQNAPWITPRDNAATVAMEETYQRVISPWNDPPSTEMDIPRYPVFGAIPTTDNHTLYPSRVTNSHNPERRHWIRDQEFTHPPILAIGAGESEQSSDQIEYINRRHLMPAASCIARFPSVFNNINY